MTHSADFVAPCRLLARQEEARGVLKCVLMKSNPFKGPNQMSARLSLALSSL